MATPSSPIAHYISIIKYFLDNSMLDRGIEPLPIDYETITLPVTPIQQNLVGKHRVELWSKLYQSFILNRCTTCP
jgi:hypothetical protein